MPRGSGEGSPMAERSLGGALTNATYEFLGHQHRQLVDEVRRATPHAHGPALAAAVLSRLHPELAPESQDDAEGFFSRWLDRHGGERPRVGNCERVGAWLAAEETMETEDLRWVGLAVLVAVAGGALVWLLSRKRNDTSPAAATTPRPAAPPEPRPVRIAVAAFSGKVRDVGTTAASAGDLLTKAAYWWSGTTDGWDALVRAAGLSTATGVPESDDALIVVVYEAPGTTEGAPSSRTEGATRMREAARSGDLRVIGTFGIRNPAQLSAAGFRR